MPDCQEITRLIQRQLAMHAQTAAVIVAEEGLGSAGEPPHRPPRDLGRQGQRSVLRIGTAADAEAAAHILRPHAHPVGRQAS